MRIAQIINDKSHYIFDADEMPNWPPDAKGDPVILIDITDKPEVQEGWLYDAETGKFTEPIAPEPVPVPEPTKEEIILARLDYLTMLVEPMEVV